MMSRPHAACCAGLVCAIDARNALAKVSWLAWLFCVPAESPSAVIGSAAVVFFGAMVIPGSWGGRVWGADGALGLLCAAKCGEMEEEGFTPSACAQHLPLMCTQPQDPPGFGEEGYTWTEDLSQLNTSGYGVFTSQSESDVTYGASGSCPP